MNDKYFQSFTGDFTDFEKNQGEFNEWQIFSNSHWRLYWNLRRHGHFKDWSISSSFHLSLECFSSKKHTLNHFIFQFHRCFWAYNIYCKSNSTISGCCDLLEWFFYQALKNSMQLYATFARGFQLELIVMWCLFMLNLLKTKNPPMLLLNVIFVQFQLKTSNKKLTPNKTNINLVSDGFCGPVFS